MPRRTRTAVRRKTSPLRWLGGLAVFITAVGVVLLLLAPTLVTRFIRSYVQRDDFRLKAEEMISAKTGGEVRIDVLEWHDDQARIGELRVAGARGWDVEIGGLHAALDFGAIRTGVWRVHGAGADEFVLRRLDERSKAKPAEAAPVPFDANRDSAMPGFLRRYLPTSTEIGGFDVERLFVEQGGWRLAETHASAAAWESGQTSVPVKFRGGTLQTPFRTPQQSEALKLDVASASLRLGTGQLQLAEASLRWRQNAEANLRGSIKFESGVWQCFTHLQNVPLDEFLDPLWKPRLSGKIKADIEASGSHASSPIWKADAALENGVIEGFPIQEKLATYTRAERFKRLVLDICQATIRPEGEALRFEHIIVQSNGLIRIEGTMTLRNGLMDGDLMVGVTPETLRWIPGAQSNVFTQTNPQGPPGLRWARVRVVGPLNAPQEDLSARLLGGAGMSLLLETPGQIIHQGAETLLKPILGGDAAKLPGKVIEGAGGVLENGVKAGADLLDKIVPGFPGK